MQLINKSSNIYTLNLVFSPIILGIIQKLVFVTFNVLDSAIIFATFYVVWYLPFLLISYFVVRKRIQIRRILLISLVVLNTLIGVVLPSLLNNQLNHIACTVFGRSFVSGLDIADSNRTFCGQIIECGWVDFAEDTWEACIIVDPFDPSIIALYFNFELDADSPMTFLASLKDQENMMIVNTGYIDEFDPVFCEDSTLVKRYCNKVGYPMFQISPYKDM